MLLETTSIMTKGILPEIKNLNLDRIKWKLKDAEEGQGWSDELCDFAEQEYKKYLTMIKLFPELDIVPNKIMDKFWHQHILDTRAYANDCNSIFGYFVHHYPYFGMNGEEDKQNLIDAFNQTKKIYKATFGSNMEDADPARCKDHSCHKPSSCACRTPSACK
ncbi:MAG: hypothetical protein K2X48_05685 [Chitinophagaceae bacterium]|nr:hypothetical protein [Chitinophagaceae bacterium]